jgi:DNA modification methylase
MTWNRFIVGDAHTALRRLPDSTVHCVITSPPYFVARTPDPLHAICQQRHIGRALVSANGCYS